MEQIKNPDILKRYYLKRLYIGCAAIVAILIFLLIYIPEWIRWKKELEKVTVVTTYSQLAQLSDKEGYVAFPFSLYTSFYFEVEGHQFKIIDIPYYSNPWNADINGHEVKVYHLPKRYNFNRYPETGGKYFTVHDGGSRLEEVDLVARPAGFIYFGAMLLAVALVYSSFYIFPVLWPKMSRTVRLLRKSRQNPETVFEHLQSVSGKLKGKYFLTDTYILIPKGSTVIIRPFSQLIWAYGVCNIAHKSIPSHFVRLVFDDDKGAYGYFQILEGFRIRCGKLNESLHEEILLDIKKTYPHTLVGFSKKILGCAIRDFATLCENVQGKTSVFQDLQPEEINSAVIYYDDLMQ